MYRCLFIIEDAIRRDTTAPSFLGLGVSCSVSASGACRSMPADPHHPIPPICLLPLTPPPLHPPPTHPC